MEELIPANDDERLRDLYSSGILYTEEEEAFNEIVRVAASTCQTPIALISLIDREKQWFKAKIGLKGKETAREESFCAHAILNPNQMLVVPDALEDARFADNPSVIGDPNIRFYAGVPILSEKGHALGTLCVIDSAPRELKPEERTVLLDLASQAATQIKQRKAAATYDALLDSASIGVISCTVDGIIHTLNREGERLTGYAAKEIFGKSPDFLLAPEEISKRLDQVKKEFGVSNPSPIEALFSHAQRGLCDEMDWTFVHENGQRTPVHLSINAIRDVNKIIIGYLILARDVTIREILLEKLRVANMEKNTFLAICAHDLKNPLAAILALAEFIKEDPQNDQNGEFTKGIITSAEVMFSLVTNLLNTVAIEEGRFPLKLENVALDSLTKEVVECSQIHAKAKSITFSFHSTDSLAKPLSAHVDINAARQIIVNLISNALKFSPRDSAVQVTAMEDSGTISISVKDSGPGISEEDQKKLFQKFSKLSAQPTGDEHSSGLGLYIVKRITELMNGEICCKSKLGCGTEFVVKFPTTPKSLAE